MPIKVCSSCGECKEDTEMVYNRLKCKMCYRKAANDRYQVNKGVRKEQREIKKKNGIKTRTDKENEILKKEVETLRKELERTKRLLDNIPTRELFS